MATIAERLAEAAVTDSLVRSENPLSNGGKWNKPSWNTSICLCNATNGWDAQTAFASGTDGARWISQKFKAEGASKFVYSIFQISAWSSTSQAERWWGVWCCMHETAQSGYRVKAELASTSQTDYKLKLEKVVAGSASVLAESAVTLPVGGKIAVVAGNGKVFLYRKNEEASAWTQVVEASDSEFTEGYGGIEARGNFFFGKNFATGSFILEEESAAPDAVTQAATSVTDTGAKLNGTVDANLASTDYYFEYGTTEAYGTKVPVTEDGDAGSGGSPISVSETISGLEPETTYHLRLVAKNAKGEDLGSDQTFTTKAPITAETVKVKVGGEVVDAARWILVGGELVSI